MIDFINGMIMTLHVVAAVVFLKFWVTTRDRLFALFALAFVLMAISRLVLTVLPHLTLPRSEHMTSVYGVRLLAYVLILAAIIDRNRRSRSKAGPDSEVT